MIRLFLTHSPYILAAATLILIVTICWMRRFFQNSFYPKKIRILIAVLRVAALFLFLSVLCDLQVTRQYYREEGPSLAFVWDLSRSMNHPEGYIFGPQHIMDSEVYRALRKRGIIAHIAGMQAPRLFSEQEIRSRHADEPVTDLGALLRFAETQLKYDYLILVSDGQSYLGEMPGQIRLREEIKLFCIGAGDSTVNTRPLMHSVKTPSYLREGDSAAFSWILENPSARKMRGTIFIVEGNDTIYRESVEIESGRFREGSAESAALRTGNRFLRWYFDSGKGTEEIAAAALRVYPSKIRILCDFGLPDPDIAMVRTLISQEERYVLYNRSQWEEQFPGETPELLIQTWHPQREPQYDRAAPAILFYRGGEELRRGTEMKISEYRSYLMFDPDPLRNALLWRQLSPLDIYPYNGTGKAVLQSAEGRTVIAEDLPNRRIIIAAAGLWRWHLAAYGKDWTGLYRNMLLQMADQSLKNRKKQFISFDHDHYEALQYLPLNVVLQSESIESADTDNETQLCISLLDSNYSELRRETRQAGGSVRPEFTVSDTGNYRLLARLFVRGHEIERDTAGIRILPYDPESMLAGLNAHTLRMLSGNNGGRFFYAEDLEGLLNEIPGNKERRLHSRVFKTRYAYGLMGLLLLFLCAEWILRKRYGGV